VGRTTEIKKMEKKVEIKRKIQCGNKTMEMKYGNKKVEIKNWK